jgi:hypothetical protein
VASGRNQPCDARNWIACPSTGPQDQ